MIRTACFLFSILLLTHCQCQGQVPDANSAPSKEKKAKRPNVVLMMVDDLGFSDIGCYGSEIQTPNLDRLAQRGLRFTQFYNCAKCETTRATLLSGQYYPEVGNRALKDCITLAEGMKLGGYRTLMTGKWHLQSDPISRGFDKYFGHLSGATNFFTGDQTFRLGTKPFQVPQAGFYTTDANVDYALKFLQDSKDSEHPFFLYIAFNAPHYPLQAPEKDVRKYIGKYSGGWDKLRQTRFKRQQELGLLPESAAIPKRPADVPAWDSISAESQQHEDLMMATYAAMVDRVDQNIGRLIAYLKEANELENTLILFLSDNGACPFQRSKAKTIAKNLKPWDPNSYWTYDKGWAHAGNTPFREYKQNQHEGGICTPFIAHWPKGIESEMNGKIFREPAHLVDIMPTILELAETDYPDNFQGKKIGKARGVSLVESFSGRSLRRTEPLFFSFYGKNNALRDGNMKLVNKNFEAFELYDLSQDRSERHDLSQSKPEQFRELKAKLDRFFKEVGEPPRKKAPNKKKNNKAKTNKAKTKPKNNRKNQPAK